MLVLGAIGWGLIAVGAFNHLLHHGRLIELLGAHLDRPRALAVTITATEATLGVALPLALMADLDVKRWLVGAAVLLGAGFTVWIVRLLMVASPLPCACSFSSAPTSLWSLTRAMLVMTSAAWWVVADDATTTDVVVTLVVGAAAAGAAFVVPDALAWPEASRAQLARIDRHRPSPSSQTRART